jgi:hypothetical protein
MSYLSNFQQNVYKNLMKVVMPHSPVEILGDPTGMLEKIL